MNNIENMSLLDFRDTYGLSVRTTHLLEKAGFETVGEVAELSTNEIRGIPKFPWKCYNELVDKLTEVGFDTKHLKDAKYYFPHVRQKQEGRE